MSGPVPDSTAKGSILGLPKNIFFLGLTSLFNDFSSEMVFSIFPAFFVSVLKAGAGALGLVDGVAEAFSNLFKICSGTLSDKFQRRRPLVIFGYLLAIITRPLYVFVSTVSGALGLRVTDRIGKGLRDAPRDAIISLSTPKEALGRSFGYHRAMDTAGSILGPMTAYLILSNFPLRFNWVFMTAFFIGIVAIIPLFFISDVTLRAKLRPGGLIVSWNRLSSQLQQYLAAVFILSIGSVPVTVILLKTQRLGLAAADIPLFYMIYSLSYAALSMPAGTISDQFGARVVIASGYLVLLVSYLFLALASSVWSAVGSFFVLGLFPALTDGAQRSLASQLAVEELRGRALGWLNAAVGLGALLAGVGGGYLWQTYGPIPTFLIAGIIVVIGLVFLLPVSDFLSTRRALRKNGASSR